MEKHFKKKQKTIIVLVVFWGMLLAVGGVIYGNQSVVSPDWESLNWEVLKDKISSQSLNCRITNQRSDFKIVEFAQSNQCSTEYAGVKGYACYDVDFLNNDKWLRTTFQHSYKQLIVLGPTFHDSLTAAATLKSYGYNVRMLDNSDAAASATDSQLLKSTLLKPVSSSQPTSASSSRIAPTAEGC